MFTNIWQKLKEIINRMIGNEVLMEELQLNASVSDKMQDSIRLWANMYTDNAPWLKEPSNLDSTRITSVGLPAFIASEKARMAILEFKSQITTPIRENLNEKITLDSIVAKDSSIESERASYLNKQYVKLKDDIRIQLEYGIAKGGFVIKPYVVSHANINSNGEDAGKDIEEYSIEFDYVQADNFYPLAYDSNGKITECAFIQTKIDKDYVFRRLEYHKYANNSTTIENRCYKSKLQDLDDDNVLGTEVSLSSVPEWVSIEPSVTINNVDRPLFAYFKMPIANTVDTSSPLGVSAYSRAVDLIKDADIQYSTLLWEYEGGQMAIDIDRDALRTDEYSNSTSYMGQLQQRLYRKVDLGTSGDTYSPFAPILRDNSYIKGLNTIMMQIENVTGLSRGTLSEVTTEARTATELKILKQRSYSANAEIQHALELTLNDAIYIMDVYCTLYNITPEGEYEVSYEWDDSILVDKDFELEQRVVLMQNGLTSKLETRMWYFGETEQQAREALNLIDEENQKSMENQLSKLLSEPVEGEDDNDSTPPTNPKEVQTSNLNPPQPLNPKNVNK